MMEMKEKENRKKIITTKIYDDKAKLLDVGISIKTLGVPINTTLS